MKPRGSFSLIKDNPALSHRKYVPWMASPLEEPGNPQVAGHKPPNDSRTESSEHVDSLVAAKHARNRRRDPTMPAFKEHEKASMIELFYDLFFVANLSTFTSNHEIVDLKSLKNYVGFFTLLWSTWLQTTLFDVRFSTDSVFDRLCKILSFGVMVGFAITGSMYDTTNVQGHIHAFRTMSLVLMISRIVLTAQYGVVLWYVRKYQYTYIPLLATMATLFLAGMIFLGTFFGFPKQPEGEAPGDQPHTYAAWYTVACVEAAIVIAISSIWRVVSFKRTHLVERVGLLTLIVMGEGIIGMSNAVSQLFEGSRSITGTDFGVIIASVSLIYFIWILYFDQIEHDRFGTIRQQIWTILHFPLHVAILLTVEGSATLILWNIIARYCVIWENYWDPPSSVNSTTDLIEWYEKGIADVESYLRGGSIVQSYNYRQNFTALHNLTAPFGSDAWTNQSRLILVDLYLGVDNVIFQRFDIVPPSTRRPEAGNSQTVTDFIASLNIFGTVFAYFYLAAGGFLLILAVMYWFGKTRKTIEEWLSILVRTVFGIGVAIFCLFAFVDSAAENNFSSTSWPLPVVTIAFLIVIVLDNLLDWRIYKKLEKQMPYRQPVVESSSSFQHELEEVKDNPKSPETSTLLAPEGPPTESRQATDAPVNEP